MTARTFLEPGPSVVTVWRELALELLRERAALDAARRATGEPPLPPIDALQGDDLATEAVRRWVAQDMTTDAAAWSRPR